MAQDKKSHNVKTPPPKKGAFQKKLRQETKRINRKPTIPRGR